jgi:hypothetical protein
VDIIPRLGLFVWDLSLFFEENAETGNDYLMTIRLFSREGNAPNTITVEVDSVKGQVLAVNGLMD